MGWQASAWTGDHGWLRPPVVFPGFYANGATSPKLKAAVSAVKGGTGRMRMVMQGDSTTVGQGGGTSTAGLAGARANRVGAVLASLMSAASLPARDVGLTGDCGIVVTQNNLALLPAYDPRMSSLTNATTPGTAVSNLQYSGGGLYGPSGTNTMSFNFTPDFPVDTFEVLAYNLNAGGTCNVGIDGAAPATGGSTITTPGTTGFIKTTVTAASVGTHTLNISANVGGSKAVNFRSIRAWNSQAPSVDICVNAACGSEASQAATSQSNGWMSLDALGFDAPDFTTINYGLNEMNNARTTSAYTAALQTLITKAKAAGDVLLVFPHAGGGNFATNVDAFNAAAKALAASIGVPFLSLYEFYGPFTAAFQARMFDNLVHPKAELYADIAGTYKRAIDALVAA